MIKNIIKQKYHKRGVVLMSIEKLYRDTEYKNVVPESILRAEFAQHEKEYSTGRSFTEYIRDCCSKNGFLEYIGEGTKYLPSFN